MLILSSKKGQVLIPPLGSCFILFPFLAYLHFNLIFNLILLWSSELSCKDTLFSTDKQEKEKVSAKKLLTY